MKWSEFTQSCLTLCDPMDCSPPGFSIHGIFQAWVLEWVAIFFSRGSSRPRDWTQVSCIACRCFTIWATNGLVPKSCLKLATPWIVASQAPLSMGFLQARVLECIAISFSRGPSWPRNQDGSPALWAESLPTELWGNYKMFNKIDMIPYSFGI